MWKQHLEGEETIFFKVEGQLQGRRIGDFREGELEVFPEEWKLGWMERYQTTLEQANMFNSESTMLSTNMNDYQCSFPGEQIP